MGATALRMRRGQVRESPEKCTKETLIRRKRRSQSLKICERRTLGDREWQKTKIEIYEKGKDRRLEEEWRGGECWNTLEHERQRLRRPNAGPALDHRGLLLFSLGLMQ